MCIYIYVYIYICVYIYVYIYIHVYIYIYVYMYVYIYICVSILLSSKLTIISQFKKRTAKVSKKNIGVLENHGFSTF